MLGSLVVVGDGQRAHVLLASGELVESIDLGASLTGNIERVGHVADRAVLQSGGHLFRSDEDVTVFEPWAGGVATDVSWSAEVEPDDEGLEALRTAWRGRGVTIDCLARTRRDHRTIPARPAQRPDSKSAGNPAHG
jgi:hypothetical protein